MPQWDFLAAIIGLGTMGAIAYMFAEFWVYKAIEPLHGIAVFAAIAAFFSGGHLIFVAAAGDIGQLPPHIWRLHLAVAGIIGIGLAFQGLIFAVKKLFSARKKDNSEK